MEGVEPAQAAFFSQVAGGADDGIGQLDDKYFLPIAVQVSFYSRVVLLGDALFISAK
jgi:hypothetical protein